MSIAVIFCSKYGATEEISKMIGNELEKMDDVVLLNLSKLSRIDVSPYDKVILGSPIYAGKIRSIMQKFCIANLEKLSTKKLGLFICGMHTNEQARQEELDKAYPQELMMKSSATMFLHGAFDLERTNFLEKFLLKNFFKVKESMSKISPEEVNQFCTKFN